MICPNCGKDCGKVLTDYRVIIAEIIPEMVACFGPAAPARVMVVFWGVTITGGIPSSVT